MDCKTDLVYADKAISKARVFEKDAEQQVCSDRIYISEWVTIGSLLVCKTVNEIKMLCELHSPFIVSIHGKSSLSGHYRVTIHQVFTKIRVAFI